VVVLADDDKVLKSQKSAVALLEGIPPKTVDPGLSLPNTGIQKVEASADWARSLFLTLFMMCRYHHLLGGIQHDC
jgi:hypothetical protein